MKDTFYFSHDYNARTDHKIKRMLARHGMEGYGIFWAIIEDLYNNANALRTDYECIAYDLRTDSDIIRSIVNDFNLFEIDGEYFGSISVQQRLDQRAERSEKARGSALIKWDNARKNKTAMRPHNGSNAIKEMKGKEKERVPARKFYDEQLKYSNDDQNYKIFIETLYGDNKAEIICNGILSLERQLGYDHFLELLKRFRAVEKSMLQYTLDIENGGYYKRRKDLYLIFNKWLEKDEQ